MKFQHLILFLAFQLCLLPVVNAQQPAKQVKADPSNQWAVNDLVKKWEGNKEYTIGVLEAMPAEGYDFVPAEGMRSFKEQAAHIGSVFAVKMGKLGNTDLPRVDDTSKETIIASCNLIFDAIIAHLKQLPGKTLQEETKMWYGPSSKNRIMMLMDNHLAHHRGQMIVYLRLKGVEPPKYVGW